MVMTAMRYLSEGIQPIQDGENIAGEIDKEVKKIIDECYAKAKELILANKNVLDSCAAILIKKEKITREEFEALFGTNNQ